MPYKDNSDLPKSVRDALPSAAQSVFRVVVNSSLDRGLSEQRAIASAWAALKNQGWKKKDGEWTHEEKAEKSATFRFEIAKADDEHRMVFGYAAIAKNSDGETITDLQGDRIDISELENAAYEFVLHSREAGEMHEEGGKGKLIESFVPTAEKLAKMGIPEGTMPGGWWVGFHVEDEEMWKAIKVGQLAMFSIQGSAIRQEVAA